MKRNAVIYSGFSFLSSISVTRRVLFRSLYRRCIQLITQKKRNDNSWMEFLFWPKWYILECFSNPSSSPLLTSLKQILLFSQLLLSGTVHCGKCYDKHFLIAECFGMKCNFDFLPLASMIIKCRLVERLTGLATYPISRRILLIGLVHGPMTTYELKS